MGLDDRHDEVVAGLYEAAVTPQRWHSALMQVTQQVGADTFHFLTWIAATRRRRSTSTRTSG